MSISGLGLPRVDCVLLLDSEGKRICAKYYSNMFAGQAAQDAFEKNLFDKTNKTNARVAAEIILFDNIVTVYRFAHDVFFYVCGGLNENELILVTILNALYDAMAIVLGNEVEQRVLLDNLDIVLLALDELVDDGGTILETDPSVIASRVAMRNADGQDVPLAEQTISQALASAKVQIARSWLKS